MSAKQVTFSLAPIYKRKKINYVQAKAQEIWPEGNSLHKLPFIRAERTDSELAGQLVEIEYDYLINATGPQLRFDLTPGLGPDGYTASVCTYSHATEAAKKLQEVIAKLKSGEKQTLVIGMGHGMCTCEGAAFEYTFNVDHELRRAGVREMARVIYLTNENELGDFGVGGIQFDMKGNRVSAEQWMSQIYAEHKVETIMGAHVTKVEPGVVHYEQLDGNLGSQEFDFAMLLPPFRGVSMAAFAHDGTEITDALFAANGFMKVDANYEAKPYEEWKAADWPETYQSPSYANVFAAGIAFAPPHGISKPRKSPSGTVITPAPPRTGMPSGVQGRTVAETIAKRIKSGNAAAEANKASMANMGAACIASIGNGMLDGSAATIMMSPIVPDPDKFPDSGRDLHVTHGEQGLAGHWIKRLLHTMFIYKAKWHLGWSKIPE